VVGQSTDGTRRRRLSERALHGGRELVNGPTRERERRENTTESESELRRTRDALRRVARTALSTSSPPLAAPTGPHPAMTIWRALAGAQSRAVIGRAPLLLGSRLAGTYIHVRARARNVAHLAARPPSLSPPLSLSLSFSLCLSFFFFPFSLSLGTRASMSRARGISFLLSRRPVHGRVYRNVTREDSLSSARFYDDNRTGTASRTRENPLLMSRVGRNGGIELCGVRLWTRNYRGSKEPIAAARFESADWFGRIKTYVLHHTRDIKWCSCVRNLKKIHAILQRSRIVECTRNF